MISETSIAVDEMKPLAVNQKEAARLLGIHETTMWRHQASLDDKDPRKILRTSYGTYPIVELERHLAAELEAKRGKNKSRK